MYNVPTGFPRCVSPPHFIAILPRPQYGFSSSALTHQSPDRVNISNADIYGLSEELNLDGTKFNNALVIFFVPYCLFEIPSNILLKKFRPHVWLSINMFLFGFTTIMQGLVKNYSGLIATRFFLGVFETGMFPGGTHCITLRRSFEVVIDSVASVLSHRHVV